MKSNSSKRRKLPPAASTAYERHITEAGYETVAGVDEAGCGALAGPVVAAAVIMRPDVRIPHVTDSKLLTSADRERLCEQIQSKCAAWAAALSPPDLIDTMNIYHARLRAMRLAVEALSLAPQFVVIDGHVTPRLAIPCEAVVGGDRKCRIVAAASIVAKVVRDALMIEMDDVYPAYGFRRHKGYGTRQHLQAIAEHGPCPIHRRSFAPIVAYLQESLDFEDQ